MKAKAKLAKAAADSVVRVSQDKRRVAKALADVETKDKLKQVVKPNSISKTLKKAGVIALLSPDPITDIPGAVLLGASYLMKNKEPASLQSVSKEAQDMLDEFETFL